MEMPSWKGALGIAAYLQLPSPVSVCVLMAVNNIHRCTKHRAKNMCHMEEIRTFPNRSFFLRRTKAVFADIMH